MSDPTFFLVLVLLAQDRPASKFPLGKETTFVHGPLDGEGYIDYESALNDRLGKGITPQKNANVLLWKALGPRPEGFSRMPAEFFKRLGIEELPDRGDYFVGLTAYLRHQVKLEFDRFGEVHDQQRRATQRPWTAQDYPHLAGWLKANEKPLALTIEACKRPEYFNPLVSQRQKPRALLTVLLSGVQKSREIATALNARALLRVGEGKFEEAWQDLLACHRLARLIGRGGTLIEALVSLAIDQMAIDADLAYLDRVPLTAKQAQAHLHDLQALSPLPVMADKIDLAERFMYLDSLQLIRRGGPGMLEDRGWGLGEELTPQERQTLAQIDWEPALRNGNRWYDRMAAAMRLKDRPSRDKELDRIEAEVRALKKTPLGPLNLARLALGKDTPRIVGKSIGDVVIGMLLPSLRKLQNNADRAEQAQRNLHLAFALAAYRHDHGRYPTVLAQLLPAYLKVIPDDLFSGKPLVYRPGQKSYLLYGIGVNGKDEGGHWLDDDPPGDDLRVRLPLPGLKPTK